MRDRNFWLRLAGNYISYNANDPASKTRRDEIVEKVADYCVANPGTSVWHATSQVLGDKCYCAPCTLARGEKLSCL